MSDYEEDWSGLIQDHAKEMRRRDAEIARLTAENERLRAAAVKAIDILHRNLYHQREKCEDAISILRQALYPITDDQQLTPQKE